MIRKEFDDRIYFQSELFDGEKISHCFTSRCGGVSCGKVEGLNLGFRVGDEKEAVCENYRLIAKDMDFSFDRITAGRQTHSANIRIITEDDAGKGVSCESDFEDVDGMVTNCKGLPLVVYYADCVPILLAEAELGIIGAVHSGWRGTAAEIAGKAVEIMVSEFGASPQNIRASIGPSIGSCCFEVGEEVACEFEGHLVRNGKKGKFFVDLWQANKEILQKSGVREENIDILELCTICHSDILYSYRCHKEATGRMGAFISLR